MIITIDGPAGAGKSTVARALARRLGFMYLDTGAMYRAVALAGMRRGVDWERPEQLADLARKLKIDLDGPQVCLDGEDVTDEIRSSDVTAVTRHSADNPRVREHLVTVQRAIAGNRDIVTEGRDQGTAVFPEAPVKVFLTASPDERARRRWKDLQTRGENATLEQVFAAQESRDRQDASREMGALVAAADAIELCTDGMDAEAVVERLVAIVRQAR
jgi:cytidylate kinase